jgi:O-antigen ligase
MTLTEKLVITWWTLILTSLHWFFAGYGLAPLALLPSVLLAVCVLLVFTKRIPTRFAPPMLAWLLVSAVAALFAINRTLAFQYFKPVLFMYILTVVSLATVRTTSVAIPLLRVAFLWQYIWMAMFGLQAGLVRWHPDLSNQDAFGPIMVIGMGMTFFYGMAAKTTHERYIGLGTAVLCLGGVVSSFARGAVISAVIVAGYIWWVMPNKKRSSLALVGGGIIVVIAAALLEGEKRGGNDSSPVGFWAEMMTIGDSEDGTTSDRKILWSAAVRVFTAHPFIGAGAANFGVAASTIYLPGEIGGEYAGNPMRLYDRALHSLYLQVLSEQGLLGCLALLWVLFDFVRKNWKMRQRRYCDAWSAEGADLPDLRFLAIGLEAGLLGFTATAAFYNQLYVHWFYTIVTLNLLLHMISTKLVTRRAVAARAAAVSRATPYPAA